MVHYGRLKQQNSRDEKIFFLLIDTRYDFLVEIRSFVFISKFRKTFSFSRTDSGLCIYQHALSFSITLSLSLSHTHTHTHIFSISLTSFSLSFSGFLFYSPSLTSILSLSLSLYIYIYIYNVFLQFKKLLKRSILYICKPSDEVFFFFFAI